MRPSTQQRLSCHPLSPTCHELTSQATDNGQTGTIMTFYEITDGDLSYTTGETRPHRPGRLPLRSLPLTRRVQRIAKRPPASQPRDAGEKGQGATDPKRRW